MRLVGDQPQIDADRQITLQLGDLLLDVLA